MYINKRVCAREECGNIFQPKAHNGKYCTEECRKKVTNSKVLKRYYDNKEKRANMGKRICEIKNCDTILSVYNKESICEGCKSKRLRSRFSEWGWDKESAEEKIALINL